MVGLPFNNEVVERLSDISIRRFKCLQLFVVNSKLKKYKQCFLNVLLETTPLPCRPTAREGRRRRRPFLQTPSLETTPLPCRPTAREGRRLQDKIFVPLEKSIPCMFILFLVTLSPFKAVLPSVCRWKILVVLDLFFSWRKIVSQTQMHFVSYLVYFSDVSLFKFCLAYIMNVNCHQSNFLEKLNNSNEFYIKCINF